MTSARTHGDMVIAELRHQAEADAASVTALAAELIRVPSRGGIDDYEPILAVIEGWLQGESFRTADCTARRNRRRDPHRDPGQPPRPRLGPRRLPGHRPLR